jgi:hypothetical protein
MLFWNNPGQHLFFAAKAILHFENKRPDYPLKVLSLNLG